MFIAVNNDHRVQTIEVSSSTQLTTREGAVYDSAMNQYVSNTLNYHIQNVSNFKTDDVFYLLNKDIKTKNYFYKPVYQIYQIVSFISNSDD